MRVLCVKSGLMSHSSVNDLLPKELLRVPYGLHDKLTEGVGGNNNGSTTNDRTNYYEVVPSNYLELAPWMEADRMGSLLETLDIAKLNAQSPVNLSYFDPRLFVFIRGSLSKF